MSPAAAFVLLLFADVLYRVGGTPELQAEYFYVTQGAALCWLCIREARRTQWRLAALLLAALALEEFFVATCGIGSWGIAVPSNSGLCVARYGIEPFAFSIGVVLGWVAARWLRQHWLRAKGWQI